MTTTSHFSIVPNEATTDMVVAGSVYDNRNNERSILTSMISARPDSCRELEAAFGELVEKAGEPRVVIRSGWVRHHCRICDSDGGKHKDDCALVRTQAAIKRVEG